MILDDFFVYLYHKNEVSASFIFKLDSFMSSFNKPFTSFVTTALLAKVNIYFPTDTFVEIRNIC